MDHLTNLYHDFLNLYGFGDDVSAEELIDHINHEMPDTSDEQKNEWIAWLRAFIDLWDLTNDL